MNIYFVININILLGKSVKHFYFPVISNVVFTNIFAAFKCFNRKKVIIINKYSGFYE